MWDSSQYFIKWTPECADSEYFIGIFILEMQGLETARELR